MLQGRLGEEPRRFWQERAPLPESADRSVEGNYLRAAFYSLAGQNDPAFAHLEQAAELGFADATRLRFDPRLSDLHRSARRWNALLQRVEQRRFEQRRLAGLQAEA